jgi:hypothetical protein
MTVAAKLKRAALVVSKFSRPNFHSLLCNVSANVFGRFFRRSIEGIKQASSEMFNGKAGMQSFGIRNPENRCATFLNGNDHRRNSETDGTQSE